MLAEILEAGADVVLDDVFLLDAAVGAAVPLLLGALGRNASHPQGARDLYGALQDHTGSDVQDALQQGLSGNGQGGAILGHVFGNRQPVAEQVLGHSTGLGADKANMLLRWLAPVAMAYVAKRMFDRRQGTAAVAAPTGAAAGQTTGATASPEVLGQILSQEPAHAERQGGLLSAVFDRDGDGNVGIGDLMKMGGDMLGGDKHV